MIARPTGVDVANKVRWQTVVPLRHVNIAQVDHETRRRRFAITLHLPAMPLLDVAQASVVNNNCKIVF